MQASRFSTDFLRVFATLAVISIHAVHRPMIALHELIGPPSGEASQSATAFDWVGAVFGTLWNEAARFSVPVFLLLSGYGLARKYARAGVTFSLREFFMNRLHRILLPFLVWSFVFLILRGRLSWPLDSGDLAVVIRALLVGNGDYHLYFFAIIVQCYIFFPLALYCSATRAAIPAAVLLLCVQLLLLAPGFHLWKFAGVPLPGWPNSLIVFWAFYFYAGILSGRALDSSGPSIARSGNARVFVGACVFAFAWMIVEHVVRAKLNPVVDYYAHFNRYSVIAYSMAVWFLFFAAQPWFESWRARPKFSEWIVWLAGLSFPVYIFHPWILRALDLWMPPSAFSYVWTAPLLMVLAFAWAAVLDRVIPGRWLRLAFGLPERGE